MNNSILRGTTSPHQEVQKQLPPVPCLICRELNPRQTEYRQRCKAVLDLKRGYEHQQLHGLKEDLFANMFKVLMEKGLVDEAARQIHDANLGSVLKRLALHARPRGWLPDKRRSIGEVFDSEGEAGSGARLDSRLIPPFLPTFASQGIKSPREAGILVKSVPWDDKSTRPARAGETYKEQDRTARMQHVIFYSWQGDRPNNTNRGFIKNALDEAATALAADLTVEPRIDHDTQNVPGSPDIARTILKKIENSDVFVADVTIVNERTDPRATPNPNVLIELGYAMKALGEDRIILVMNEHFGPVEQLSFDLRARRIIVYNVAPDAQDKATERRRLTGILRTAIKPSTPSHKPQQHPTTSTRHSPLSRQQPRTAHPPHAAP